MSTNVKGGGIAWMVLGVDDTPTIGLSNQCEGAWHGWCWAPPLTCNSA